MYFRDMSGQYPLQGEHSQRLVQTAPKIPPDTARVHIHDHRQVDEIAAQADVDDTRYPDLVRTHNLQALHQIGAAREAMLVVRLMEPSGLDSDLQTHLLYQAAHSLVVGTPSLTAQLCCDTTIAVGGPFPSRPSDGRLEFRIVWLLTLVVVAALRAAEDATRPIVPDRRSASLSRRLRFQ